MSARLPAAGILAALLAGCAQLGPSPGAAARPLMPVLDVPQLARQCEEGLARARQLIAAMESGGGDFFAQWNELQIAIEDARNPISVLGSLHPDKAVRDAAEPCLQKYTVLYTGIFQSEKLFARVSAASAATPAQAKLKRNLVEGFEDSGVALPPAKRSRALAIFTRLEELRQAFERNVREDKTVVVFTPAEMAGLPESYLKRQKRDAQGNYVLRTEEPAYVPFMTNARDAAARQRFYMARFNVGGMRNIEILDEAYRLRKELAGLYGLPTFAHYVQRRRMAGSPEAVTRFLGEVKTAVTELERRELAELAGLKARETGEANARIHRWDVAYYTEKVRRERFAVDQESLRKYFPTAKAVDYALLVAETLYGVRFREDQVPTWLPDVRYFDVLDARSGRYLAGIYLDLFPREGKRGGAWASGVRRGSSVAGRTPLSVMSANLNREGLGQRELETLLHEFGHVLHNVLSTTPYVSQSGTTVKRDFVEAPSQMFEEWVRREQPLALMKKVCPECPQLSRADIERLDGARNYGQGIRYSGQWLLASFDMALSTNPRPPLEVWRELEAGTLLGHVPGVVRPASFSHVAGSGYAAGYYGYMWSEVLALDMLSAFKDNLLDPATGARYRDTILAPGGSQEEMEMVRRFLGRAPNSDAFFAEITGKR